MKAWSNIAFLPLSSVGIVIFSFEREILAGETPAGPGIDSIAVWIWFWAL